MKWYIRTISSLFFVAIISCREIQPLESDIKIQGYRLKGKVTSVNGVPIDSAVVILSYTYTRAQTTPLDTIQFSIPDSLIVLHVGVYTPDYKYVRKLFYGIPNPGVLQRFFWNELDDSARVVPSGKYLINYEYGDSIIKTVPWLAEGNESAYTNKLGEFELYNQNFPIGEVFDFFNSRNEYEGTFRVLPEIKLKITKGNLTSSNFITLQKDRLTYRVFTIR